MVPYQLYNDLLSPFTVVSTGSQLPSLTHSCNILVVNPDMDFVGKVKISFHKVKYLVLDEADTMLDMWFMPYVKKIVGDQ